MCQADSRASAIRRRDVNIRRPLAQLLPRSQEPSKRGPSALGLMCLLFNRNPIKAVSSQVSAQTDPLVVRSELDRVTDDMAATAAPGSPRNDGRGVIESAFE